MSVYGSSHSSQWGYARLDLFCNPSSRLDHTIAVAYLALRLARRLRLSQTDTAALVVASLLHDVGHAPFSHNSEPFLLERRNLYHQGVTAMLLRQTQVVHGEPAIGNVVMQAFPECATLVLDLVLKKACEAEAISELFSSPLNCDKIEGNHRTLSHLGLPGIVPLRMIDSIELCGKSACVRHADLPLVEKFWTMEHELYWQHIYTLPVFSAEAMVTRALSRVFVTSESVTQFINSTDAGAVAECQQDAIARELLHRVYRRDFLVPLSTTHPRLLLEYRDEFVRVRFDMRAREVLEQRLAKAIHADERFTISHFSRRKHFGKTLEHLQPRLFESTSPLLPLRTISVVFTAQKKSGDFFDVFYAQ